MNHSNLSNKLTFLKHQAVSSQSTEVIFDYTTSFISDSHKRVCYCHRVFSTLSLFAYQIVTISLLFYCCLVLFLTITYSSYPYIEIEHSTIYHVNKPSLKDNLRTRRAGLSCQQTILQIPDIELNSH